MENFAVTSTPLPPDPPTDLTHYPRWLYHEMFSFDRSLFLPVCRQNPRLLLHLEPILSAWFRSVQLQLQKQHDPADLPLSLPTIYLRRGHLPTESEHDDHSTTSHQQCDIIIELESISTGRHLLIQVHWAVEYDSRGCDHRWNCQFTSGYNRCGHY